MLLRELDELSEIWEVSRQELEECATAGAPLGAAHEGPGGLRVLCCWSSQKTVSSVPPPPSPTFLLPNEIWQLLKIAQRCSRHSARPSAGWHAAGGGHCGQTLAHAGPGVGVTHTARRGGTELGA